MSFDLEELGSLLAAATPGPWHVSTLLGDGEAVCYGDPLNGADEYTVALCEADFKEEQDAALVVALRNHAAELIEAARERDRLRAALETMTERLAEANRHMTEARAGWAEAVRGASCEWHGPNRGEVTGCCIHNAAQKRGPT